MKRNTKLLAILTFYIVLWEILSLLTSSWMFPGPVETLKALVGSLTKGSTYIALFSTAGRIILGLLSAIIIAVCMSIVSVRFGFFRDLFYPFILMAKSVPVACLTILCIIWFGSQGLTYFVVLLVGLPIIYTQLLAAIDHVDDKRELCIIYDFSRSDIFRAVYLPQIRGQLGACLRLASGMSLKAGIAAEVIGMTTKSIGEQLYMTKLYFDTDKLFAWIILIMLISFAADILLGLIYTWIMDMLCKCPECRGASSYEAVPLIVDGVCKSYDEKKVLDNLNIRIEQNGMYAFCKSSGWGKSTALHIISGLTSFDKGSVQADKASYAFQEVKLIEQYTATENISIALKLSRDKARELLDGYLSDELKDKPVAKLSGGERRRVELARALNTDKKLILLDEPFAGLDDENIDFICEAIRKASENKKIIISLHEVDEAIRIDNNISIL